MKKDALVELMRARGGRVTVSSAESEGYTRSLLKLLEAEGVVVNESRGVYCLADTPVDDFAVIALRWPRLVFSHGTALWLLGLSDRVPSTIEMCAPQGYRAPAIEEEYPGIRIRRVRPGLFELGAGPVVTPTGTQARAYNAERCLCDLLAERRKGRADLQLFRSALRGYMAGTGVDLLKLARYAQQLGVSDELRDVMEVIS